MAEEKNKIVLIGYSTLNWQDFFRWHYYDDRANILEYKLRPFLEAHVHLEKTKVRNYAVKKLRVTVEEIQIRPTKKASP